MLSDELYAKIEKMKYDTKGGPLGESSNQWVHLQDSVDAGYTSPIEAKDILQDVKDILQDVKDIIPEIKRHLAVLVGGSYVFWGENESLILIKNCNSIALPQDLIQLDKDIREAGSFSGGARGYLLFSKTCKETLELLKRYPYINLLPYEIKAAFVKPNFLIGDVNADKNK